MDKSRVLSSVNSIISDYEKMGKVTIGLFSGLNIIGIVNNKENIIKETNRLIIYKFRYI